MTERGKFDCIVRYKDGTPYMLDQESSDGWNRGGSWEGWEYYSRPPMFPPRDEVLKREYISRYEKGEIPATMNYGNYAWMWSRSMDIRRKTTDSYPTAVAGN